MRVGLECSLHTRAVKWGGASMVTLESWQLAWNGACMQEWGAHSPRYLELEGARWVWAWLGETECKQGQFGSWRASWKLTEKCQVKNSMEKMVNMGIWNAVSVELRALVWTMKQMTMYLKSQQRFLSFGFFNSCIILAQVPVVPARAGVTTRSMRSQQAEFLWALNILTCQISVSFPYFQLVLFRTRSQNSELSLPSPGYVARGGVPGPPTEHCPHCFIEILSTALALHLATYHSDK